MQEPIATGKQSDAMCSGASRSSPWNNNRLLTIVATPLKAENEGASGISVGFSPC